MLVVLRYRVPVDQAPTFREQADLAVQTLADQPGWIGGQLGRAADDPTVWVLVSHWRDVGSYRRALSSYAVKLQAVPLLSRAVDEPTAFEVLSAWTGPQAQSHPSARAADADDVGLGAAASPTVRSDVDPSR